MADPGREIGDTFVAGAPGEKHHLWIIVAETPDGALLGFDVTTFRAERDTACVLERDAHPWLTHKSMVLYSHGRTFDVQAQAGIEATFGLDVPATQGLIRKVRLGAIASIQTPNKYKDLIRPLI